MKLTKKQELIVRGALRTAATTAVVAGLCHAYPAGAPFYFMAGYAGVMGSIKFTKNKFEAREKWTSEPHPEPEYSWMPKEHAPEDNLLEKVETKVLNPLETIQGVAEKIEDGMAAYKEHKRQRLIIKDEEKLYKLKHEISHVQFELDQAMKKKPVLMEQDFERDGTDNTIDR